MAKQSYLFAVQRDTGHEVVSATIETDKVTAITAHRTPEGRVEILNGKAIVNASIDEVGEDVGLTLLRWPANDKLAKPVSKAVSKA